MKNKIKIPKIGDKIYVPSCYYVYRGEDNFEGGLATINKIEEKKHLPKDDTNYWFVGIEGRPTTMWNWKILLKEQNELKRKHMGQIAHSNPDLSAEFNQPDADWK